MRRLVGYGMVLAMCLLALPAHAYRLAYKDVAGSTLNYQNTMAMTGNVEVNGTVSPFQSTTGMMMVQHVDAVTNGVASLTMQLKDGKTTVKMPPSASQPDGKTLEQKLPDFTLSMDRSSIGKVSNIKFVGKAPSIPGMQGGGDWVNRMLQQGSNISLPDHDLAIGDTWQDKMTLEILPGAKADILINNKLAGTQIVNGKTYLVIATTMTMSLPDGKMTLGQGDKAMTIHLNMDMKGTSETLFDEQAGVILRSTFKSDVTSITTIDGPRAMTSKSTMAMNGTTELCPPKN